MKNYGYCFTVALCMAIAIHASAQDEHFTLQRQAPLHYNPAFTGMHQASLRGGALYRTQWGSIDKPFTTSTAYADKALPFRHDMAGAGLALMNDRNGPVRLTTTKLLLSGAYHKRLGAHIVSGGIQPGIVWRNLRTPTFGNQYVPAQGNFDPALPSGEDALLDNRWIFVLNTGFAYSYMGGNYTLGAGQAFYQVNQPNESQYDGGTSPLHMRSVTQVWGVFHSGPVTLRPQLSYLKQQKATEVMAMAIAEKEIAGPNAMPVTISAGLAARNNLRGYDGRAMSRSFDALAVLAGLRWDSYQVDLAYDINTSDLRFASNGHGAFELAVTYLSGTIVQTRKIAVPCLRY
jgi:type IX secretion system PorP/SprF family membrane protein